MKHFDFATAVNQLGLNKQLGRRIAYNRIPYWVKGEDFLRLFLPYLVIVGDSREQDKWVEKACAYYGIGFVWAKDDIGDCLKEGDYSYKVCYGNREYNYIGKVAYERKGSVSEFYGNCTGYNSDKKTSDRERIEREFDRFVAKKYDKVVLLLEFGEKLTDLIDMEFAFRDRTGALRTKSTGNTMYSAVKSWQQPNNKNFDVIQASDHEQLFWQWVQDMYYYYRNEIRAECLAKGILERS